MGIFLDDDSHYDQIYYPQRWRLRCGVDRAFTAACSRDRTTIGEAAPDLYARLAQQTPAKPGKPNRSIARIGSENPKVRTCNYKIHRRGTCCSCGRNRIFVFPGKGITCPRLILLD